MGRPNFSEIIPVHDTPNAGELTQIDDARKRITVAVQVINDEGAGRTCTVYGQIRLADGLPSGAINPVTIFPVLITGEGSVTRVLDASVAMQYAALGVGYDGVPLVDPSNIRVTLGEANDG